ncbi:MAG: GNAT family N-acetyltransferase [Sphingobacteriia bacterium]|nr:GNAT family N-acetyltransferase [Sphingobacteriia bacterium]
MEILTDRLVLREYSEDDLELLHSFRIDKNISKYIHWNDLSFEGTRSILKEGLDDQKEENRKYYHFVICLKQDSIPIGEIGINIKISNIYGGICILGYFMHKQYWHNGYMSEAAHEIIKYAFSELKLHKIEAYVDCKNKRSIKVLKRLGMKKEAKFKKEVFVKDRWEDVAYYALVK